ncbi:urea transport system ATP-binding protein [Saccharothrix coeruleofusca]|nr:urea transport system ATP-binding protein [Saccharothrix coeruleofusca]
MSLEVPTGSLVCLMGRNGVGKTTLLKTTMGLLRPAAGRVELEGEDITGLPTHQRVRRGMAFVPQGHVSFPQLTVWENLQVTLEATSHRQASAVEEALAVFPTLRPLFKRPAGFLSGGQRQQLAIARALITRPRLLLLDEPTEGVQPSVIDEIELAVRRLHRQAGLTVLLVEQYLDLALRLADSFVVLDAGRVAHAGPVAELHDESVRRLLSV